MAANKMGDGTLIVRLTPGQIERMTAVFRDAVTRSRSVRICTGETADGRPWWKYDNGSGWTAELYGEPF